MLGSLPLCPDSNSNIDLLYVPTLSVPNMLTLSASDIIHFQTIREIIVCMFVRAALASVFGIHWAEFCEGLLVGGLTSGGSSGYVRLMRDTQASVSQSAFELSRKSIYYNR